MIKQYFTYLNRMSAVTRYSQTHLLKPESVLEHIGFSTSICYLIGHQLKEQGYYFDFGVLLAKAVVHDSEEISIGDIPRPTKHANETIEKALEELENEEMSNLSVNLTGGFSMSNLWSKAKEGPEGFIVQLADSLAVICKVYQECELGNRTILDHLIHQDIIRKRKALVPDLFQSAIAQGIILDIMNEAIDLCDEIQEKHGGTQ